jgi:hypothetical protein
MPPLSARTRPTASGIHVMLTEMTESRQVLDRMSVPKHPNVYYLGRRAVRLTFISQQTRAVNLVWALKESNLLGRRVAVVGGGLAGITAARAASLVGAHVVLFERQSDTLHLQRDSRLRFVHPYAYDWPDKSATRSMTKLPFLNWSAESADRIVEAVLRQWSIVGSNVEQMLGYEVTAIAYLRESEPGMQSRPLVSAKGDSNYAGVFDCVIVAVGFGLERDFSPIPFLSYWDNDNLSRPVLIPPIPRRYLVTGCGDGGLIDAIRLSVRDFDHGRFVHGLMSTPALNDVGQELLRIDEIAAATDERSIAPEEFDLRLERSRTRARELGQRFAEEEAQRRISEDLQSEFIESSYRSISAINDSLFSSLGLRLRADTIVVLNGGSSSPFSLRSQILNRFGVYLLQRFGRLKYRAGRLEVPRGWSDRPYRAVFRHEQSQGEVEVDEIVVRHGVQPVIQRLFPPDVIAEMKRDPIEAEDPTRHPLYPADYWSLNSVRSSNLLLESSARYAISSLPRIAERFFDPIQVEVFGIRALGGKVSAFISHRYYSDRLENRRISKIGWTSRINGHLHQMLANQFDH